MNGIWDRGRKRERAVTGERREKSRKKRGSKISDESATER